MSAIVYFSWTIVIAAGIGLMTGTAGFVTSLVFTKLIYSAIKVSINI